MAVRKGCLMVVKHAMKEKERQKENKIRKTTSIIERGSICPGSKTEKGGALEWHLEVTRPRKGG
jgi:hypothetical protein